MSRLCTCFSVRSKPKAQPPTRIEAAQPTKPPAPTAATTFHSFALLPHELRSKIWRYALLHKRWPRPFNDYTRTAPHPYPLAWPKLLAVCQESRGEAIRYFGGVDGEEGRFAEVGVVIAKGEGGLDKERTGRRVWAGGSYWWDVSVVRSGE